eukprot:Platyproteum_vivax@DN5124_c0_g1_i2.p2
MESYKILIYNQEMPEDMRTYTEDLAQKVVSLFLPYCDLQALNEKMTESEIADFIKKNSDAHFGGLWSCIVGASFGAFVTHFSKCYIYFSIEHVYILLWKTNS